jgi:DNA-binding response OmpR family regulator
MEKILIVEDDNSLSQLLEFQLKYAHYDTDTTPKGKEAIELIRNNKYNLVILDIMLLDGSGIDICKEIRKFSEVPVIMLTAKDSINDKICAFDAGTDDYLTKPFEFAELLARIKANTRKAKNAEPKILSHKGITIYLDTYRAERDGIELHLTKKELKILQLLLENKGKVISKEEIINKLWQGFYEENNNIISVYINYLRNKVDKGFSEKLIENVRGIGYIIR